MTTRLINENQVIVAESLRVKNMVRNRKLAKTIADAGWGEICRQLKYKAEWYGRQFVQFDTFFPSSQICSVCSTRGPAVKDLREHWVCRCCGIEHDRDVNAAKNILADGFGGRCARRGREAHHALAVAHGERQEGTEDDGGGARDDDCRDYPRVGRGAFGKVI